MLESMNKNPLKLIGFVAVVIQSPKGGAKTLNQMTIQSVAQSKKPKNHTPTWFCLLYIHIYFLYFDFFPILKSMVSVYALFRLCTSNPILSTSKLLTKYFSYTHTLYQITLKLSVIVCYIFLGVSC